MVYLETTIYADVLFFVNFSMDFITLWISAILTSRPKSALKMCLGAAVGGLYGVLSVIFHISGTLTYFLAGTVSILMCIIAFGFDSIFSLLKQSAIVFGCGALLGGVMTAVLSLGGSYEAENYQKSGGITGLLACASVVFVYITVRLICNTKNRKYARVLIKWKGRDISFFALCDSGNLMRDPFSGDPVILLSKETLAGLCGEDITEAILSLDGETLSKNGISLRLIPHRSDSQSSIIGGFVPDLVTVECNKRKNRVRCVIAPRVCPENYYAGYPATLPASLLP